MTEMGVEPRQSGSRVLTLTLCKGMKGPHPVPSTWHRAGSAKGPFYPGAALPMHASMHVSHFYHFRLFATLWIVARQVSPSMGFSRQEYWSGLPCPPPGIFPDRGIEPVSLMSPALAGRFFTTRPSGKPKKEAECSEYRGRLPPCKMQARLWKGSETLPAAPGLLGLPA